MMHWLFLAVLTSYSTGRTVLGRGSSPTQSFASSPTPSRNISIRADAVDTTSMVFGVVTSIPVTTDTTSMVFGVATSIPVSTDTTSMVFGVATSVPITAETTSEGPTAASIASDVSEVPSSSVTSSFAPASDPIPTGLDSSAAAGGSSDINTPSSASSTLVAGPGPAVATPDASTLSADSPTSTTGTTSGGDTSGGDTSGGDTSGGDTSGGDTSGGDTSGGDTSGGDTSGGDTSGGDTSGGDNSSKGDSSPSDSSATTSIQSPTETTQPAPTQTGSSDTTASGTTKASDNPSSTTTTTSSTEPTCTVWDISPLPDQCQNTDDEDGDCDDIDNGSDSDPTAKMLRRTLFTELKHIAGRLEYLVTTTSGSVDGLITAAPQVPETLVRLEARKTGIREIRTAGSCLLRSKFKENPYPRGTEYALPQYQAASRFFPVSLSNLPPPPGKQGPGCPIPVLISTSDVGGISTVPGGPTYRTTSEPPPTPWINSDHVYELSLLHEFFADRLNVDPNAPSCNDFSNVFEVNNRLENIWRYMPGDAHLDLAAMDQNINGAKARYFDSAQGAFPTSPNVAAKTQAVLQHGIAAAAINHPVFVQLFQRTHQRLYDAFKGMDASISACGIQVPAPTWASAYSGFVTSWLSEAGNRASSRASAVYSDVRAAGSPTSDFVAVYPPTSFLLASTDMASLNLNNPPAPIKRDDALCPNTAAPASPTGLTVIPITPTGPISFPSSAPESPTGLTVIPITPTGPVSILSDTASVPVVTPGAPLKITGVPDDISFCSLDGGCMSIVGAVSTITVNTP